MSDTEAPAGNTGKYTEPEIISPPRPGRPENLRPAWTKGVSGNPKGRPKTKPLTDAFKKLLGKRIPPEALKEITAKAPNLLLSIGKRPTYADLLAYSTIQQGIRGNIQATARILDRVEGKVPKEITGGDAGKLDELMQVLMLGGAAAGDVNEGVEDAPEAPMRGAE